VDDHLREGRQVRAEPLEQRLELRNDEDQENNRDDDGNRKNGSRVKQRLLDLLLQRFRLFFVGGDLVEQRFQRTGMLASLDQVHEQVVEVQGMLRECLVQRRARFDIG